MRTLHFLSATLLAMLLINMAMAENADTVKVQKRIVKTVQISDDGKTIVDTTMVFDGDAENFFFRGDCGNFPGPGRMMHLQQGRNGGQGMAWTNSEDIELLMEGDSANVMIFRRPGAGRGAYRFEHSPGGKGKMHWDETGFGPRMERLQLHRPDRRELIDLNDPSIISFEKESLKNGNEKITIVRKVKQ